MRKRVAGLTLLVVVVFGLVATLWVGSMLSRPTRSRVAPPPRYLQAETVRIPSSSGAMLTAWYSAPANPVATAVLLHPVGGNRAAMLPRAKLLRERGFALLVPDLQAHGESEGEAVTFGYLESRDAVTSLGFLRERHPDLPLVAIGVSLGGAALALAGSANTADAVVLEAVYPTIEEAVTNRIAIRLGPLSRVLAPLLLVQLEPRLGFQPSDLRPIDSIGQLGSPVLILGGERDRHTTSAETRRLYEAARQPKQLWVVQGAGHQDFYHHAPAEYEATVLPFLARHLGSAVDSQETREQLEPPSDDTAPQLPTDDPEKRA